MPFKIQKKKIIQKKKNKKNYVFLKFHASVTLAFFSDFHKIFARMKNKEIGNNIHHFGEVFVHFLIEKGLVFGPKSGLGKSLNVNFLILHPILIRLVTGCMVKQGLNVRLTISILLSPLSPEWLYCIEFLPIGVGTACILSVILQDIVGRWKHYCKFGNFHENFIVTNSAKRHICDVKNSPPGHDLPISVNNRVISPFHKGFYFHETSNMLRSFVKIKPSRNFHNLQYSNYVTYLQLLYLLLSFRYLVLRM